MKVFLDANIFLYASGNPHALRDSCTSVLRRVTEGGLDAATSAEVVQEVVYVRSRRVPMVEAVSLGWQIIEMFPDLLPVGRIEVSRACSLLERHPHLLSRDAVHVATMLSNGIDTLVSVDQDFDAVEGIRRLDPRDL